MKSRCLAMLAICAIMAPSSSQAGGRLLGGLFRGGGLNKSTCPPVICYDVLPCPPMPCPPPQNHNTPPSITKIKDTTVRMNTSTQPLVFTVKDKETSADNLSVSIVSANTVLVPLSSIVQGGQGESRTLAISPAKDQIGTSLITLTVKDTDGLTASESFSLTVTKDNAPILGGETAVEIRRVSCVMVFDTNGKGLAKAAAADRDRWVKLLEDWKNGVEAGLKAKGVILPADGLVSWTVLDGAKVTKAEIEAAVDKAGGKGEALFVWYTGHGETQGSGDQKDHVFTLGNKDEVRRRELFKRMQGRTAPLTVLLTESCSIPKVEVTYMSVAKTVNVEGKLDALSDLLFRHTGEVDINSSTEPQLAIALPTDGPTGGGLLSRAYQELSDTSPKSKELDADSDGLVTWEELKDALVKKVAAKFEKFKELIPDQTTQTPKVWTLSVRKATGYPSLRTETQLRKLVEVESIMIK